METEIKNGSQSGKPGPGKRTTTLYRAFPFLLLLFTLLLLYFSSNNSVPEITWTEFRTKMLDHHHVAKLVIVNSTRAEVYLRPDSLQKPEYEKLEKKYLWDRVSTGPHYYFNIGSPELLMKQIDLAQPAVPEGERVEISYSYPQPILPGIISWLLPVLLLIGVYLFVFRRAGGVGRSIDSAIDFTRSRAQEYDKGKISSITFLEVAGYDEAKIEVMEVVDFLKNPARFTKLGAKIPKGVLLVGPPGTGKTLMAKAVAGEAAVPFFSLSASEFIEMFVGVGASRVRDLFAKAKEKAPSIIFIDEIDTIGRIRGRSSVLQSNDERESTLNQLLAEMDGFDANTGVIVIAATNRADILDPALLRAGRFDRHIYLELPNRKEREAIYHVHLKSLLLDAEISAAYLAAQTPGFSGADIANACNEAALIAARRKRNSVSMEDFSDAIDRIIAGLEKKTRIITPAEKKIIAYHEAGHAIASWLLKHVDPLIKVSIIPRGKSLGSAWYIPEERQIITYSQFTDRLSAMLGGRAAEELIFNEASSGAIDDLEKATKLAYSMVARLGLSKKLGAMSFEDTGGDYDNSFKRPYSEATALVIDDEAKKILDAAYLRTSELLRLHKEQLETLARLLLQKEVVNTEDMEAVLGKRPPGPDDQAGKLVDTIGSREAATAGLQVAAPQSNHK